MAADFVPGDPAHHGAEGCSNQQAGLRKENHVSSLPLSHWRNLKQQSERCAAHQSDHCPDASVPRFGSRVPFGYLEPTHQPTRDRIRPIAGAPQYQPVLAHCPQRANPPRSKRIRHSNRRTDRTRRSGGRSELRTPVRRDQYEADSCPIQFGEPSHAPAHDIYHTLGAV